MKKPLLTDSQLVRKMSAVPSDDLIAWYCPDWMRPYVRLSLKRLRRLEKKK